MLSIKYISRKFFTPNEKFELAKIYNILGKIKSALVDKGLKLSFFFLEINPETKRPTAVPCQIIDRNYFIEKVKELEVPNLSQKEIEYAATFLSQVSEEDQVH